VSYEKTAIDELSSLMVHAEARLDAGLHENPRDVYLGTTYYIIRDAQKIIKELYKTLNNGDPRLQKWVDKHKYQSSTGSAKT